MKTIKRKIKNYSGVDYLYLLRNPLNGAVKIGISVNPSRRFNQLNCASGIIMQPLFVFGSMKTDVVQDKEYELHFKYKEQSIVGEWFKLSENDIDNIQNHLSINKDFSIKHIGNEDIDHNDDGVPITSQDCRDAINQVFDLKIY